MGVIYTDKKFSNEYIEYMVKWWGMWFSTRPFIERFDTAGRSMKKNILVALSRDPISPIKDLAERRLLELGGKKVR